MFVFSAMAEITTEQPSNIDSWSWAVKTNSLRLSLIGLNNLANTNSGLNVKIVNMELCPVCKHKGRRLSTALLSGSVFWVKFCAFISVETQPVKGCKAEIEGWRFLSSGPWVTMDSVLVPSAPRGCRALLPPQEKVPAVGFSKVWQGSLHSLPLRTCLQ